MSLPKEDKLSRLVAGNRRFPFNHSATPTGLFRDNNHFSTTPYPLTGIKTRTRTPTGRKMSLPKGRQTFPVSCENRRSRSVMIAGSVSDRSGRNHLT